MSNGSSDNIVAVSEKFHLRLPKVYYGRVSLVSRYSPVPSRQISTDDETQCEDEGELAHVKVSTEYQVSQNESAVVEASRQIVPRSEVIEEDCHASLDAELSDTQPPLQIDTEDTDFSGTVFPWHKLR